MKKINLVFVSMVAFAFFVCMSGVVSVHYVPDNYAKMQWEVDNAYAGDTIIVRDGYENVVNKDHLTIKSESGAERTIVKAVQVNLSLR